MPLGFCFYTLGIWNGIYYPKVIIHNMHIKLIKCIIYTNGPGWILRFFHIICLCFNCLKNLWKWHRMEWFLSHCQGQARSTSGWTMCWENKEPENMISMSWERFRSTQWFSFNGMGFNLYWCSQFSSFMPGMGDTIFSAYTQLNLSNGIHVGTIFHIGMEGCLHHLQESGVTAKGNDPTPQAREIDNFSSWISIAASNTWAVKILGRLHSKARKQIPCVYEIRFSPKQWLFIGKYPWKEICGQIAASHTFTMHLHPSGPSSEPTAQDSEDN